ncbi:MAG: thioesterase family protein [Thermaerobacter sp.]|nr:thioesterase family protein [Thermaerobacter sp.]
MAPENPAPTFRGVVDSRYIDHMGHMNVQYYVHLFDQATWVLFDRAGLSASYFSATGCGMAALEQHIFYKREVFAGTIITIYTQVLAISDKTVRFVHTMEDGQGPVATCELVGAHFDRAAHRAVPFPPDARAGFQRHQTPPL